MEKKVYYNNIKKVEMEVTKSVKQEILTVRLEAYDFSRGRFTAHPNLWGTTDTRNGLPTTTRESPKTDDIHTESKELNK